MEIGEVRAGLVGGGVPERLADELLGAYEEAKSRFHLGDYRPNAVEGGRFAEAVFRALEHLTTGAYTPLGKTLTRVDELVRRLENVPAADAPESVRIHIPRTLRVVYDLRNKRDAAHLADDIDPNLQDATLVVACLDWVLAELVRLHHDLISADEARAIIEEIVVKEVPVVQEIAGQPVLLAELTARDQALLMLYRAGSEKGATLDELAAWLRVDRKDHLRARLRTLDAKRLVLEHPRTGLFHITSAGVHEVEERKLAKPA